MLLIIKLALNKVEVIVIKVNDIGTLLIFTINDPSDSVVNLATATSPSLCILDGNNVKTSHSMTIYNATAGQVSYMIVSGDLASTGVYKFEVRLGFPGGSVFTSSRTFDVVEPTLCP
jgi:hypothetical protein